MQPQQEQYITALRQADVLLGRGSGPNDHEGNIRFRSTVADRKPEYMATNHRLTKARIAQEIVDSVYVRNGRFLRRVEPDESVRFGIPDGVDAWMQATDEVVMEKAKQALRQNTGKARALAAGAADGTAAGAAAVQLSPQRQQPSRQQHQRVGSAPHSAPNLSPAAVAAAVQQQVQAQSQAVPSYDDFEPIPLNRPGVTAPHVVSAASSASGYNDRSPVQGAPHHQQQQHHHHHTPPPSADVSISELERWANTAAPPPAAVGSSGVGGGPRHHHFQQQHQQHSYPSTVAEEQDGSGSILAHLPQSVLEQYTRGAQSGGGGGGGGGTSANSNKSMANIPIDDGPEERNRRGSMTMRELEQYHAARKEPDNNNNGAGRGGGGGGRGGDPQGGDNNIVNRTPSSEDMMADLLDSTSRMSITADQKKMYASTETMGTIEPIGLESMADMSMMSMEGSSMFSFVKGLGGVGNAGGGINQHHHPADHDGSLQQQGQQQQGQQQQGQQQQGQGPYSSSSSQPNSGRQQRPAPGNLSRENENKQIGSRDSMSIPPGATAAAAAATATPNLAAAESVGSAGSVLPRPLHAMGQESADESLLMLSNFDILGGSSSLSVLKSAFASADTIDVPPPPPPPREQGGDPQQQQQQQQQH